MDQQSGPFYTIQSAIDKAKSGSIIKINTGLYKENLVIKGKSLSLEARDINSEVYILGSKGPTLLIEDGSEEQQEAGSNTTVKMDEPYPINVNDSESDHHFSLNKNFLHSKTEINPRHRSRLSSSEFSDSQSSEERDNYPGNVQGNPGIHTIRRRVNSGLRRTVKEQLRNLKKNLNKIHQ